MKREKIRHKRKRRTYFSLQDSIYFTVLIKYWNRKRIRDQSIIWIEHEFQWKSVVSIRIGGWKDYAEKCCRHFGWTGFVFLESVNFELVCLDESDLSHPVADVVALIALKLKNFSVLRMLHYRSIASKLLKL